MTGSAVRVDADASRALAAWSRGLEHDVDLSSHDAFGTARARARRLGAHVVRNAEGERVEFGFWAHDLDDRRVPDERVRLELYLPHDAVDPSAPPAVARFTRVRLPLERDGAWFWAAVRGVPIGTRTRLGALYALAFTDEHGAWTTRPDPLGASYPFGAFAPAEVYDVAATHAGRADAGYFERLRERSAAAGAAPAGDGVPRFPAPTNVLQLHVASATEGGTVADLTRVVRRVAGKVAAGAPLTPFERCFTEYDAFQPLPLEPTIEREAGRRPWSPLAGPSGADDPDAQLEVEVALRRPDVRDWGYDVAFVGMGATNPALLQSGRPDELVDLAVALHTFPGKPLMLILDLVYGHADDQSLAILAPAFVRGPNMYGQDVNQQHPAVRAIMLEMQRRRVDVGADGIRVDGAQDLKTYDPVAGVLEHDDDYLLEMGEVVQEVAGVRYRPFCIFEDGRPWPREDWPTASRYREVTERQPHVFQWGPLTFAHNTPALEGFWWDRWWRVEQILAIGDRWVSGCANHDTVRRGTQLDPEGPINRRLGSALTDVLQRAYDHPAGTLLTYVALPGLPMDFLNAIARAPWGFVRDTDDRYAIKVAAEEAGFLEWQVADDGFAAKGAFVHLKALGFEDLASLRRAMRALEAEMASGADPIHVADRVAPLLPAQLGQPAGVDGLKRLARAFMADAAAWCNVEKHASRIDEAASTFAARVRALRRARPWLAEALRVGEWCRLLEPPPPDHRPGAHDLAGGAARPARTRVDALRVAPDGGERLWLVANLEGEAIDVDLAEPPSDGSPKGGRWRVLLASPGAVVDAATGTARLPDGEGVVLVVR
ncbi:MAG: glucosylglycerol hydrolase [Trueperaceae bacterium]